MGANLEITVPADALAPSGAIPSTSTVVIMILTCFRQVRCSLLSMVVRNLLRFILFSSHYSDVIMGVMASQIICLTIVDSAVYLFMAQITENIKAPRHWPLCGEFTGDRRIPRTNGQ